MASTRELLDSISPDMKLNKAFFLKVYADELTWPGFAEEALRKLEAAGCGDARYYYKLVVAEYNKQHEEELKKVAAWYSKQIDKEYEYRKGKAVREQIGSRKQPRYKFNGFPEDW